MPFDSDYKNLDYTEVGSVKNQVLWCNNMNPTEPILRMLIMDIFLCINS